MAELKREKIAVLLRAGTAPREVCHQIGAARGTVWAVKNRLDQGMGPHPPPKKPEKLTPMVVAGIKPLTLIGLHRSTVSRMVKTVPEEEEVPAQEKGGW